MKEKRINGDRINGDRPPFEKQTGTGHLQIRVERKSGGDLQLDAVATSICPRPERVNGDRPRLEGTPKRGLSTFPYRDSKW